MPPSRNQTPSNTSHKPPYPKERAAGMKGTSRQSSTGSTGATGVAKSSPDKKPVSSIQEGGVEIEDAKMDKRKRRSRKRDRASQVDDYSKDTAVGINVEEREVKEERVVKARPLAPSTITQVQNATNQSQPHPTTAPKHSSIPNTAPQPSKNDRSSKLEQKVEKQRIKLKEAEARAALDAERSRKDTERIKQLEESVKEIKAALEAKEEAAEGVQGVVDEHLQVCISSFWG
jgi:hypothetical protein